MDAPRIRILPQDCSNDEFFDMLLDFIPHYPRARQLRLDWVAAGGDEVRQWQLIDRAQNEVQAWPPYPSAWFGYLRGIEGGQVFGWWPDAVEAPLD